MVGQGSTRARGLGAHFFVRFQRLNAGKRFQNASIFVFCPQTVADSCRQLQTIAYNGSAGPLFGILIIFE